MASMQECHIIRNAFTLKGISSSPVRYQAKDTGYRESKFRYIEAKQICSGRIVLLLTF